MKIRVLFTAGALFLSAGCTAPFQDGEPGRSGGSPAAPMNSAAVLELSADAEEALNSGRPDRAVQLLERAIRIEPRNGALWHELARVYYGQGKYEQAMQFAGRSNALPATDGELRDRNDELIRAARQALAY